jgi:diphthine-ammonia ligase
LRLAAFYSGGKDSTFSIFKLKEMGHDIVCLISMYPSRDDNYLFHYPNIWLTKYLAEAMQIPLTPFVVNKGSEEEAEAIRNAVLQVKAEYDIQGIVHGAISSNFQNELFKRICFDNRLVMFAPLWNAVPIDYMHKLLAMNFNIIIVAVAAMGLERSWLGRSLDRNSIALMELLSKKYGFNLSFEGGEVETLVLDCPLYSKRLDIKKAAVHWDGQRGIFEILEATLVPK